MTTALALTIRTLNQRLDVCTLTSVTEDFSRANTSASQHKKILEHFKKKQTTFEKKNVNSTN